MAATAAEMAAERFLEDQFPDEHRYRSAMITHMPRSLPSMQLHLDYFPVGHDMFCNQYNIPLAMTNKKGTPISFFFAGVGDARHIYTTLYSIMRLESWQSEMGKIPRPTRDHVFTSRFHMKALDLNPKIIARDLVMFLILDSVSRLETDEEEAEFLGAAAFFVFMAPAMPEYFFSTLQDFIQRAIRMLAKYETLPSWLCVYNSQAPSIIRALEAWQEERMRTCNLTRLRRSAVSFTQEIDDRHPDNPFDFTHPQGCDKERASYEQAGFMWPPKKFGMRHEPELQILLNELEADERAGEDVLMEAESYVDAHWLPNVTLSDIDFWAENQDFSIAHDPFQFVWKASALRMSWEEPQQNSGFRPSCLCDYGTKAFIEIANSIRRIRKRLTIELMVGEMTEIMDRCLHDIWPVDMDGSVNGLDLSSFPTKFDKIHMSNVPDYIGGSLASQMYAAPLLKQDQGSSYFTSCCLRNVAVFQGHDEVINEYLATNNPGVNGPDLLWQVFKTLPVPPERIPQPIDDTEVVRGSYDYLAQIPGPYEYEDLLDLPAFQKWLYTLLFKIMMPYYRSPFGQQNWSGLIYWPFNVTIFFRLLSRLHDLGYPTHFIVSSLNKILTGVITTTARPPRSCPLSIEDATRNYAEREIDIFPFLPELRTQAGLWARLFTFGGVSGLDLCSPTHIYKYTMNFSVDVLRLQRFVPVFQLLFFNTRLLRRGPPKPWEVTRFRPDLPSYLNPDELPAIDLEADPADFWAGLSLRELLVDDESSNPVSNEDRRCARQLRTEGMIVVSAIEWSPPLDPIIENRYPSRMSYGVGFWMDESVMDKMLSDDCWAAALIRNDIWCAQSDPVIVVDRPGFLQRQYSWKDAVAGATGRTLGGLPI